MSIVILEQAMFHQSSPVLRIDFAVYESINRYSEFFRIAENEKSVKAFTWHILAYAVRKSSQELHC